MEKIIFTILIFLIAGLPLSLQAVKPISKIKGKNHSIVFSKNQKKPNFIQRIFIKKIKRRIDRQSKRQKKKQLFRNANLSFFFGLLTVLVIILGYIGITSATTLGPALMRFIIYGLLALIFGIISLINAVKYFQKNNPSGTINFEDFKAWFGIGVSAILALLLMMLLFGS